MAKINNNKKVGKKETGKKGFTLVELLVVILITSIIVGLSAYGVIYAVNSSKDASKKITMSNLQEAAKTYSLEHDDSVWHSLSDNDYKHYCGETKENQRSKCPDFDNNYKYFCVTIQELINRGLLNKEKIEVNNINPNIYVMVKKHKMTSNVLNGTTSDDVTNTDYMKVGQYNLCTREYANETIVKSPSLGDYTSHTDDLIIGYEEGETQVSDITEYTCSYGESSNDMSQEVKGNNKKCVMTSLKNNTNYYVKVCMKTDRGSIVCSDSKAYKTKDFISPEINNTVKRNVKIEYHDDNVLVSSHYFQSTIKATTDKDVTICELSNEIYTCDGTTNEIKADTWYKVDGNEVNLEYLNQDAGTTVTVTTTIADGSNNNKQFKKDIVIEKDLVTYTATFHKGLADTINGGTSDVKISCQAEEGKSCTTSEVAPNITRDDYNVIGWNTNRDAKNELFKSGTKVTLTGNRDYYPITSRSLTIKFYPNNLTLSDKLTNEDAKPYGNTIHTGGEYWYSTCIIYNSSKSCKVATPVIEGNGYYFSKDKNSRSYDKKNDLWENAPFTLETDGESYYAINKVPAPRLEINISSHNFNKTYENSSGGTKTVNISCNSISCTDIGTNSCTSSSCQGLGWSGKKTSISWSTDSLNTLIVSYDKLGQKNYDNFNDTEWGSFSDTNTSGSMSIGTDGHRIIKIVDTDGTSTVEVKIYFKLDYVAPTIILPSASQWGTEFWNIEYKDEQSGLYQSDNAFAERDYIKCSDLTAKDYCKGSGAGIVQSSNEPKKYNGEHTGEKKTQCITDYDCYASYLELWSCATDMVGNTSCMVREGSNGATKSYTYYVCKNN